MFFRLQGPLSLIAKLVWGLGIFLLPSLWAQPAFANCVSPAAVDGQILYIHPLLKYCEGTTWRDFNNTNSGVACSQQGRIEYISGDLRYCDGTTWRWTANAINHGNGGGTCHAGVTGRFYYASTGSGAYYGNQRFYWYCNGANWRRMGSGAN